MTNENNNFRENILEEISEKSQPPEVPKTKKPRMSHNSESVNEDTRSDMDRNVFLSSLNEKIQSKKGADKSLKETSEVEEVDAVHFR